MLFVLHYENQKHLTPEIKNNVMNSYKNSQYTKIIKEKSIKLHRHRKSQ